MTKKALAAVRALQAEHWASGFPPDRGLEPRSQRVIAFSLVRGTRGYIETTVHQINACYQSGCFDACAVMIRRLVETLIIEAFEAHGLTDRIKNPDGGFLQLGTLIDAALSESTWNLGRNTRAALPRLKQIGDLSAHSRRYNAHRSDIDKIIDDIRVVTQELVYLARLR